MEEKTSQTPTQESVSRHVRFFAGFGIVCFLALVAWGLVGLVRYVSYGTLPASVRSVFGVFSSAPEASLVFALDSRTLVDGEPLTVHWNKTPENTENHFLFSYACPTENADAVRVEVQHEGVWQVLPCNEEYKTTNSALIMRASLTYRGFKDITLSVRTDNLVDTTLVTLLNTRMDAPQAPHATSTLPTEDTTRTPLKKVDITPLSVPTYTTPTPVTRQTTIFYDGLPANLVLEILDTGIMDRGDFKKTSPISYNKTAAVRFAVTNRGGAESGKWFFTARLPVQGNSSYKYVSSMQDGLPPLARMEYTLSFDDVLRSDEGVIRISLSPAEKSDRTDDNEDAVTIDIKR